MEQDTRTNELDVSNFILPSHIPDTVSAAGANQRTANLDRRLDLETTSLSARGRLALDTALFIALFIASDPAWTGISLHEWLAGLLVLPALYHVAINWDWVVRAATKVVAKLNSTSRANFVVDVALFLATVTVMLSGFMVIPGVISTAEGTVVLAVWQQAHKVSSDVMVVAMLVHFALHARWMSDVAARGFLPKRGRHAMGQPSRLMRARGRR